MVLMLVHQHQLVCFNLRKSGVPATRGVLGEAKGRVIEERGYVRQPVGGRTVRWFPHSPLEDVTIAEKLHHASTFMIQGPILHCSSSASFLPYSTNCLRSSSLQIISNLHPPS